MITSTGHGYIPQVLQSWQCSTESWAVHCQHAAALQSRNHRYVVTQEHRSRQSRAGLTASGHDARPVVPYSQLTSHRHTETVAVVNDNDVHPRNPARIVQYQPLNQDGRSCYTTMTSVNRIFRQLVNAPTSWIIKRCKRSVINKNKTRGQTT